MNVMTPAFLLFLHSH